MIIIHTPSRPIHLYLEPTGYPAYSPDYISIYPTLDEESEDVTICHREYGNCGDCANCPLGNCKSCSEYPVILKYIVDHYHDQLTNYPELLL